VIPEEVAAPATPEPTAAAEPVVEAAAEEVGEVVTADGQQGPAEAPSGPPRKGWWNRFL
jgi:hypothetical protein